MVLRYSASSLTAARRRVAAAFSCRCDVRPPYRIQQPTATRTAPSCFSPAPWRYFSTTSFSDPLQPQPPQQTTTSSSSSFALDGSILRHALNRNPHPTWDASAAAMEEHSNTHQRHLRRFAKQQQQSVSSWQEQLQRIVHTSHVLNKAPPWNDEEWRLARRLLDAWSSSDTIRSVVLQFALYHRCLQEGENTQHHTPQQQQHWLDSRFVLEKIVHSWRLVMTSTPPSTSSTSATPASTTLTQAGLGPTDVLVAVVQEFHGHYSIPLHEKLLYLIAEGASGKGHFPTTVVQTSMELWHAGTEACFPQLPLWNLALSSWIQDEHIGPRQTVQHVLALVEQMKTLNITWDKSTYHRVITAWANLQSTEGALQAEQLLYQFCSEHVYEHAYANPDVYAFTMVCQAWKNSQSPEAGPRMVGLYHKMQELRSQGKLFGDVSFDKEFIHSILECYGNSNDTQNVGAEAEQFWRSTLQEEQQQDYQTTSHHAATYVSLISLYCKAGHVQHVERLLNEMMNNTTGQVMEVIDYMALFKALAKSNLDKKVELADQALEVMKTARFATPPTTAVYNAYLTVVVTSIQTLRFKAFQILKDMKKEEHTQPDKITYTIIMNGFVRFGDITRAGALLRTMYDEFMTQGNQAVAPDIQAFNTVLAGYAKSDYPKAAEQAEAFLRDMRKMHTEQLLDIKPDVYTLASVLACYAKSPGKRGKAAGTAQDLMREARDWGIRPNLFCYNNVMDAWARDANPRRAEAVFMEMCEDYKHGNESAKPDASSFNILLKAWGFSKKPEAAERAEQILRQMQDLAESGEAKAAPNIRTYTALVTCLGLSKTRNAPQRAEAVVRQMDELFAAGKLREGPSLRTFQMLKKAWKYSREPNRKQGVACIEEEIRRRFR